MLKRHRCIINLIGVKSVNVLMVIYKNVFR